MDEPKVSSTGEPTYRPSDRNKIPNLLDYAITKGISEAHSHIESNFDLSSDHSTQNSLTHDASGYLKKKRGKLSSIGKYLKLIKSKGLRVDPHDTPQSKKVRSR
jgi:hypothetical protein